MDTVMDIMGQMSQINAFELLDTLGPIVIVAMIVAIVIGLILCFFGLKLVRVLTGLSGLVFGCGIGVAIVFLAKLDGTARYATVAGCGLVLAILFAVLYRFGLFFWALLAGTGVALLILMPDHPLVMVLCVVIGIALGAVTVVLWRPLVIIQTSIYGGVSAGIGISYFLPFKDNILVTLGICVALSFIGMLVQFFVKSKEVGRKEKDYADEYREKASMETEVERARSFFDGDEDLNLKRSRKKKKKKKDKKPKKEKNSIKNRSKKEDDIVYLDDDFEDDLSYYGDDDFDDADDFTYFDDDQIEYLDEEDDMKYVDTKDDDIEYLDDEWDDDWMD